MPLEIERKFLLQDDSWRIGANGTPYRQGYLNAAPGRTVRIRLAGNTGYITIKGKAEGLVRSEYEYVIPASEALEMLENLCERPQIEKTRYEVVHEGHTWEIDEFHGENAGLIVAEIELDSPEEAFARPAWLGREVSDDRRYFNSQLAKNPYQNWKNS